MFVAFGNEAKAFKFEQYLKSPSGRPFAKKRLQAPVNNKQRKPHPS
jgi:hypothetical protein